MHKWPGVVEIRRRLGEGRRAQLPPSLRRTHRTRCHAARGASGWRRTYHFTSLMAVLWSVTLCACGAARQEPVSRPPPVAPAPVREPFSISLVPAVPVPIRVATDVRFQLSLSTAGYASLYLIDPVGQASVLAENLPLAAGNLEYPSAAHGFTIAASEPVGFNRVILLVTRQPFDGFSGDDTLTSPVSLALNGDAFVAQLSRATALLRPESWAMDEIRIRVVG